MSPRNWIAVASADHVAVGRQGGFMQVNHGKEAPLRRLRPGDRVVYYSPRQQMRGGEQRQAFTALGVVADGPIYRGEMGNGDTAFRRDVHWQATQDAPIRPLLEHLSFGGPHWGAPFRYGLFEITADDMAVIAEAMRGD
ncbi:EVE domain-containing protein [Rhodobacter sp. NTK016B]|uniref:EVE domain-containing protein n=1 Tax=Rhodobacter sp. NTK016B TaxID=2759676 RepID=UPI001A8EB4DB|nr:EVE domain-containing protein [Rhodobacter sp. NTK016B]MBN8293047.1 EVE domain-containing protein [Rhodobacter sp. NTK016B]